MPITMQEIRQRLDIDEPDYSGLSTMGAEALPHLAALVRGDDAALASKAAYLASMIDGDDAQAVVQAAAESPDVIVRVAAAAGLRNLAPARALGTVERMLADTDAGVRKQALRAIDDLGLSSLEDKMKAIAATDPEQTLRTVAKRGMRRLADAREVLADKAAAPARKAASAKKTAPVKRASRKSPKKSR